MLRTVGFIFAVLVCCVGDFGVAAEPFSEPGSYAVGQRSITVQRSDGTTFPMELFYPADSNGIDVPLASGSTAYPAISFGPGFLQTNSQYFSTLRHLASWGYYAASTESQFGFAPNKPQYAQDLSDMLSYLEISNSDLGSDLSGRVAVDRFGVAGHSLGGGVSILTAANDTRVKAVANFAAASTNAPPPFPPGAPPTNDPSAIDLIAAVNVPVSLISGSADTIVPTVTNGQLMYDNANAPKLLPSIVGASHCGFVDKPITAFCDVGTITPQAQQALARAELTSFFETYLGQNNDAWRRVWGPERSALTGVQTQSDAGILLVANESFVSTQPGQQTTLQLTLTNLRLPTQQFDLFADDSPWPLLLSAGSTPLLAANESFSFQISLQLPEQPLDLVGQILVSARSRHDGGTRGYQIITVAVPEPNLTVVIAVTAGGACVRRRRSRT
jgi:dienelactone hydrolase